MGKPTLIIVIITTLLLFFSHYAFSNSLTEEEIAQMIENFSTRITGLDNLRDPFLDYRWEITLLSADKSNKNELHTTDEDSEDYNILENRTTLPFKLIGIARQNNNKIALIVDNNENIILKKNEQYGDLKFIGLVNRSAIFMYKDVEYMIEVGGQAVEK